MGSLHIRKLTSKDLPDLVALYKQFWNEDSNLQQMQLKFSGLQNNPNYLFLAATVDEKLVGSLMGVVCEELYGDCRPFMVMEDLVVDQAYRRHGIGRALMEELEKHAREQNCTQLIFITETSRTDAVSFYQGLGYNVATHTGFKKSLG